MVQKEKNEGISSVREKREKRRQRWGGGEAKVKKKCNKPLTFQEPL